MHDWIVRYWLGAVFSAVTGILCWAFHCWRRKRVMQAAIKDGMLALLHDRIYSIYRECVRKKYAAVDDIRNLEYLYYPYHTLGGNGTGTELFERVKSMPTEPPQEQRLS
ncbi:MAG TPA: hypothetical protein DG942_05325 [Ruminococcaceae bacterium]|nr:hypothetical protein [Oscillospiraceae bacterium]